MELMSSALLCVLVALLPQTLVRARNKSTFTTEKNEYSLKKPLSLKGPASLVNVSELHSVFNDFLCKSCSECMRRAITAHGLLVEKSNNKPSDQELREHIFDHDVLPANAENEVRTKRGAKPITESKIDVEKKLKPKKNKSNKSVTVTKYDMDGEVYALKVKETQLSMDHLNETTPTGICQVYSVKKSLPCESPETEALLLAAKRKANKKKLKKEQEKKLSSTTSVPSVTTTRPTAFKKREVDNSQVPENFMPSIEDFF